MLCFFLRKKDNRNCTLAYHFLEVMQEHPEIIGLGLIFDSNGKGYLRKLQKKPKKNYLMIRKTAESKL